MYKIKYSEPYLDNDDIKSANKVFKGKFLSNGPYVDKLEKLYKAGKYSHKRIWQVGMIMYVRLKVYYDGKGIGKDKKVKQYKLAKRYFKFLGKRTKIKGDKNRMKMKFKV